MTAVRDPGVVILGAGGHAAVIIDLLRVAGRTVAAAVDAVRPAGESVLGVPIVGSDDMLPVLLKRGLTEAVVAVGDNRRRRALAERALSLGFVLVTIVHPTATISSYSEVGKGSVVMAGAVINARTRIGTCAIVNTGATIDHDCILGEFCHVAPGASLGGGVRCGDGVLIGIGAVVLPGVAIGADVTVGGGAAVTADLAPGVVAVGVPARPVDRG